MKVVIFVDGGVVQAVHSDTACRVVLVDADNLADDYSNLRIDEILDDETSGCSEIPISDPTL